MALSSTERFVQGMAAAGPLAKRDLYWLARISFVSNHGDIALFDAVFGAVFDLTLEELKTPQSRSQQTLHAEDDRLASLRVPDADVTQTGAGLPWTTLPSVTEGDEMEEADDDPSALPDLLPSADPALAETPFDLLDAEQLLKVEQALADALHQWPTRRSRRRQRWSSGDQVALRATLRSALRTGGEPLVLHRTRQRTRPRRVVMLLDVSGSMETFARPYLHLTRALVTSGRAEVFAFATELTRITATLKHRSPTEAINRASEEVGDRFGGTRLASSLHRLLTHPTWSGLPRGSVVLIASDGWDTDDPNELQRQMAKLSRLAHCVIWINPRSAQPDYEPLVAPMAAALPYCTQFLSGHSLGAMTDVIDAITRNTASGAP